MKPLNLMVAGPVNAQLQPLLDDLRRQGCRVRALDDRAVPDSGQVYDAILISVLGSTPLSSAERTRIDQFTSPKIMIVADDRFLQGSAPAAHGAQALLFPPFHPAALQTAIENAIRIHSRHSSLEQLLAHYMEGHRHLGEAILLADSAGIVRFANDWAKQLLGADDGDLYGLPLAEVFPIEEDAEGGNPLEHLPKPASGSDGQLIEPRRASILSGDGQTREVLYQVKAVGDGKSPRGIMLLFHEFRLRRRPKQVVALKDGNKTSPVTADGVATEEERRTVRIQTFGEFQITIDDLPIDVHRWRSKKALDALCLLLHSYGKPVQKDILIDFLWPEADSSTGNRRLLNVISELRKYLEPSSRRYARNNFIRHESGMYRLAFEDNVYLDSALFRDLVRQGDYHWGVGEYRMARTYYQEALQHKFGAFMPRYLTSPYFEEAREYYEETEDRIRERLGISSEH